MSNRFSIGRIRPIGLMKSIRPIGPIRPIRRRESSPEPRISTSDGYPTCKGVRKL